VKRDKSLLAEAVIEAARCRRAVADGSPRDFWHMRLSRRLAEIDDARTVLKCAIDGLGVTESAPREG
jgi:hypothetical protein